MVPAISMDYGDHRALSSTGRASTHPALNCPAATRERWAGRFSRRDDNGDRGDPRKYGNKYDPAIAWMLLWAACMGYPGPAAGGKSSVWDRWMNLDELLASLNNAAQADLSACPSTRTTTLPPSRGTEKPGRLPDVYDGLWLVCGSLRITRLTHNAHAMSRPLAVRGAVASEVFRYAMAGS